MRYSGIIMYGWHGSKAQFLVRCLMIDTFVSKEKGTLFFFWILYLARTISVETFEAQTGKYSGILVRQCCLQSSLLCPSHIIKHYFRGMRLDLTITITFTSECCSNNEIIVASLVFPSSKQHTES